MQMENQNWNDWRFQMHWNKLEWFNPRIRIEQNNPLCESSKRICLEDNNKTAHWVGHSELKPLDTMIFLKKNSLITYKFV